MRPIDYVLLGLVVALSIVASGLALRGRRLPRRLPLKEGRRVLVPFSGSLDPTVLAAAIRIAHAEDATLVPAYLVIVPLEYTVDSPLREEVQIAMPLLEAVEHAALSAGVPVDARIEKGRSLTHALRLLWEAEHFDRIVAPATADARGGFGTKELTWLLTNAPAETLVLKPHGAVEVMSGETGEVVERHALIRGEQAQTIDS